MQHTQNQSNPIDDLLSALGDDSERNVWRPGPTEDDLFPAEMIEDHGIDVSAFRVVMRPGEIISTAIAWDTDRQRFDSYCGSHSPKIKDQKWQAFLDAWKEIGYVLPQAITKALEARGLFLVSLPNPKSEEVNNG